MSKPKTPFSKEDILNDYYLACLSRAMSTQVRKEVLQGRAKFGSGGGGKELAQLALAHAFEKGDFLSGYYRDQTVLLSKGLLTPVAYFSFLYGDAVNDPFSGGRQMNNCYATPTIGAQGEFLDLTDHYNVASVIAPVAGHMPRSLGLALASKVYREQEELPLADRFSRKGKEVCFATIGDASTAEGPFFETVNAAAVLQVPLAFFVWDDGYGISVPQKYQIAKQNISGILDGFRATPEEDGIDIYRLKAWDYMDLRLTITRAITQMRETHRPALFHVQECTQPNGHSTSGSHERYKSTERLAWEEEWDCLKKMEEWIIQKKIANQKELQVRKKEAEAACMQGRDAAWQLFRETIDPAKKALLAVFDSLTGKSKRSEWLHRQKEKIETLPNPVLSHLVDLAREAEVDCYTEGIDPAPLQKWIREQEQKLGDRYHTHLYSSSEKSALKVPVVEPVYSSDSPERNGSEILNAYFDKALQQFPELSAFGEDVGKIGDVNQGFTGLQDKHGAHRVYDTGIREWTIIGQGMGMAMRGLRPIAELQYLDYLAYAFPGLTDDLATLRWRTNNLQQAPLIVRTRGHRLEGIWHSGSPIGMLLHSMRGIYVLVPRNMVQAAGMYQTLLQGDDPAILIECLNGYRLKERLPDNIGTYTIPLGVPEVLTEGTDVTLVTYGSCVRVAQAGMERLSRLGISVELIDVQTLLPFDIKQRIITSIQKTNRLVVLDEDVPGGASAFILQQLLEEQDAYHYLDSKPVTITAADHRPAYADDGNYTSKPNAHSVFAAVYAMMQEADPQRFLKQK